MVLGTSRLLQGFCKEIFVSWPCILVLAVAFGEKNDHGFNRMVECDFV
jgi:hypothetical protein